MSTDSSSSAKNLEQTEAAPTVLLIAAKQNQFSSAASFLTRRGIPCTLRGNIKDGISFITKNKPTYVFLSWNLPNANIVKTYQLFVQKFNLTCIVFAETTDGKTAAELSRSRLPETMQAPVSGPGLYMRIQKLMKSKDDHSTPEIRQTREGYKKEDDKQNFIRMSSGIKHDDKPGIINFQKTKYSESDIEDIDQNPISDADGNDISEYLKDIELEDIKNENEQVNNNRDQHDVNSVSSKDFEQQITMDAPSKTESQDLSAEEAEKKRQDVVISKKKKKEVDYGSVVNIAKNSTSQDIIINEPSSQPNTILSTFTPKAEAKGAQSILFQETLQAFKNCTRPVEENYQTVGTVSKAKLLNIHTQRFSGYLIIVVPMYYELDKGLFSEVKANLQTLLKKQGETLFHFEELNADLEQVDFIPWCRKYAEFFIQTADKKNEIVCAYFPVQPSLPKVDEKERMAAINVADLKANTKSNINLFIHLPKNNKFLRYLKPGDTITEKHKEKFEKNNVKNLHIKKEEITNFREYFVSQQLNDTIRKKTG